MRNFAKKFAKCSQKYLHFFAKRFRLLETLIKDEENILICEAKNLTTVDVHMNWIKQAF